MTRAEIDALPNKIDAVTMQDFAQGTYTTGWDRHDRPFVELMTYESGECMPYIRRWTWAVYEQMYVAD